MDRVKIQVMPDRADAPSVIRSWLVDVFDNSSLYNQFVISLFHLKPIDGKRANKATHKMTHELLIIAVNPATPIMSPDQDLTNVSFVTPVEVNLQFKAENNKNAAYLVAPLVDMVTAGAIGVSGHWRKHWVKCLEQGTKHDVYHLIQEGDE